MCGCICMYLLLPQAVKLFILKICDDMHMLPRMFGRSDMDHIMIILFYFTGMEQLYTFTQQIVPIMM